MTNKKTKVELEAQSAQPTTNQSVASTRTQSANNDADATADDFENGYMFVRKAIRIPVREQDLCIIVRQLVGMAPARRKVPTLFASIAPLSALATRVRVKYVWDIQLHALLVQIIIEAAPSTGKRPFAEVVRIIIEPTLEKHDNLQRRMEQEYRERKSSRAQNEKIGEAPKTTIRCIPATISKTVLLKRADLHERLLDSMLTFWMFGDELALLGDAGKSSFSNLRTILRIAYDLNSRYGQDYASDNSYSGNADVCISFLFCATPQDVNEIFPQKEVMGGGASRVMLITLEDEIGSRPAVFKPLSEDDERLVSAALKKIMDDTYAPDGSLRDEMLLDTSWLDPSVKAFCAKMAKKAADMKDAGAKGALSLDHFYKRASVNAFRCAGLMYYLYLLENRMAQEGVEGAIMRDEKEIRHLCIKMYKFIAQYCLESNNSRWGAMYESGYHKQKLGAKVDQRKPLIEQLTTTFTRVQLDELIEANKLDTEARHFLSQWKKKGWIIKIDKNTYQKQL